SESLFDQWEHLPHPFPVLLPGEVDGYTGLPVTRAHPEIVCRDSAYLGNLYQRRNVVSQAIDSAKGGDGVLPGHQVFALQLLATAWSELHSEVRQALKPGAHNT